MQDLTHYSFDEGEKASLELLEKVEIKYNSDDFVFDNQMLAQIFWHGFTIGEVSCPTKYFKEASSINFQRSCKYGFGCLWVGTKYRLAKRLHHPPGRYRLGYFFRYYGAGYIFNHRPRQHLATYRAGNI